MARAVSSCLAIIIITIIIILKMIVIITLNSNNNDKYNMLSKLTTYTCTCKKKMVRVNCMVGGQQNSLYL